MSLHSSIRQTLRPQHARVASMHVQGDPRLASFGVLDVGRSGVSAVYKVAIPRPGEYSS